MSPCFPDARCGLCPSSVHLHLIRPRGQLLRGFWVRRAWGVPVLAVPRAAAPRLASYPGGRRAGPSVLLLACVCAPEALLSRWALDGGASLMDTTIGCYHPDSGLPLWTFPSGGPERLEAGNAPECFRMALAAGPGFWAPSCRDPLRKDRPHALSWSAGGR